MKEISLHILDIVQNSIRAGAKEISIGIIESRKEDLLQVSVSDNGKGISEDILNSVTDPFFTSRTTRGVGLGLPLLKYHAELTGGSVEIKSEPGKGTDVIAKFSFSHFDRQPMGDITGVLMILISANPEINFIYLHKTDSGEIMISSRETKEYLEVDTLSDYFLLKDLGSMLYENLKVIGAD